MPSPSGILLGSGFLLLCWLWLWNLRFDLCCHLRAWLLRLRSDLRSIALFSLEGQVLFVGHLFLTFLLAVPTRPSPTYAETSHSRRPVPSPCPPERRPFGLPQTPGV